MTPKAQRVTWLFVIGLLVHSPPASAQLMAAPAGIQVRLVRSGQELQQAIAEGLSEEDFNRIGIGLTTIRLASLEIARNDSRVVVRFFRNRSPVPAAALNVTGLRQTAMFEGNALASLEPTVVGSVEETIVLPAAPRGVDLEQRRHIEIALAVLNGVGTLGTFYVRSDPPVRYETRVVGRLNGEAERAAADRLTLDEFLSLGRATSRVSALAPYELHRTDLVVARSFRGGEPLTNKDAGIQTLAVAIPEHESVVPAVATQRAVVMAVEKDAEIASAQHGTMVTVALRSSDAKDVAPPSYVNRFTRWDAYGWPISSMVGVWFPIGLVGTNFTKTSDGMVFSAAPVSVAIGSRMWLAKDYHLGFSGIFSWAVSNVKTDGAGNTSEFTLKTFGGGFLVDVLGWANVGTSYVFSLGGSTPSPGWMLVAGLGPKAVTPKQAR
jgi:hypothetical protein